MARDSTAPTSMIIETALAPLWVQVVGSGPPAVLWHSLFVDSTTWSRVGDRLAGHRRLILIDGPCHGRSGVVDHAFTLDDCAAAACEVLDRLAVDDRVDWVGNAWGGHVGTVLAAAAPHRCRSLTAIGAPVRALSGAESRRIKMLLAVYRVAGPAPLVKTLSRALLGPDADPEADATVSDAFRGADRRGMAIAIKSISLARTDLTPTLSKVTAPTLFVAGAEDAMWPPAEAAESVRHLADAAVATLPGAGHVAPLLHDASDLAALIIDFWTDPARYIHTHHAAEIT